MRRVQAIANRYSRATMIAGKNEEIEMGETTRLFVRQCVADAMTLAALSTGRGDSRFYAV